MASSFPVQEDPWAIAARNFGQGAVEGYHNRSDEKALQKTVSGLKPDASAREILDAITQTKTHSAASKQNMLKNYLGVTEFEELQRKNKAQEEINKLKANKTNEKTPEDRAAVKKILEQTPGLEPKQKEALGETLSHSEAAQLLRDQQAEQRIINKEERAAETSKEKKKLENREKLAGLEAARGRVELMRAIRKKGNLGFSAQPRAIASNIFGSGEAAKDVGEYETLGNSLISFASDIVIRNQKEFEKLTGRLTDPYITDKEAEGIINSLERIINDSMAPYKVEGASLEQNKEHKVGDIKVNKKTGQKIQFDGASWIPI